MVPGKTVDEKECKKMKCPDFSKVCHRLTGYKTGTEEIHTVLRCGNKFEAGLTIGCQECGIKELPLTKTWECWCKEDGCNGADRTSYTHLIIAVIVGAMFLH